MPTIELILRDDNGQIMGEQSVKKYPLDWKTQSFHDIEGAVKTSSRLCCLTLRPVCWKQPKVFLFKIKKRPDLQW